jgi:hypothetical protein
MGLDMYLTRANDTSKDLAYWRKANQIHGYIVDTFAWGVDECQPIAVHRTELLGLVQLCESLLESKDEKKALEVLPPKSGFFFGSAVVDEWYWDDLEKTVRMLTETINFEDKTEDDYFIYQASW